MNLSILICSLPERAKHLAHLMSLLSTRDGVEIIVDNRPRTVSTGQKRNELIARALGKYVCFIDDDDEITSTYLDDILRAIELNPDVVTFKGWMTTNGMNRVDWVIQLGEKYEARQDSDGVTRYYRFPNHLCPIRKAIAESVKFLPIWNGEDYGWAKKVHDYGLLRSEVHIDKQLYHYKFVTGK